VDIGNAQLLVLALANDFREYLLDPAAFELSVKTNIMLAAGLGANFDSQRLVIVSVAPGSIVITFFIKGAIVEDGSTLTVAEAMKGIDQAAKPGGAFSIVFEGFLNFDKHYIAAPGVVASRLSDCACGFFVEFDSPLALNSIRSENFFDTESDHCADWLVEAPSFGDGAACTWQTSQRLLVTFGVQPAFQLQSAVNFVNGTVRSDRSRYTAIRVAVDMPATLPPVEAEIAGPSRTGKCDKISIDASSSSGGGSFGLSAHWSFQMPPGAPDTVKTIFQQVVQEANTKHRFSLEFAPNTIAGFEGSIVVTITNMFLVSDNFTHPLVVETSPIPLVDIIGSSSITSTRNKLLDIVGEGSVSSPEGLDCLTEEEQKLEFSWTVSPNSDLPGVAMPTAGSEISLDGTATWRLGHRGFSIPSKSLLPTFTYTITMFARSFVNPRMINSDSIAVDICPGNLVALIAGGSRREASTEQLITLDASGSKDLDMEGCSCSPINQTAGYSPEGCLCSTLAFTWSYIKNGKHTSFNDSVFTPPGNAPLWTIQSGSLDVGTYNFNLEVTDDITDRSDATSITVEVLSEKVVAIELAATQDGQGVTQKVDIAKKLVLGHTPLSSSDIQYQWSIRRSGVPATFGHGISGGWNLESLVVDPGTLSGGVTYIFKLNAKVRLHLSSERIHLRISFTIYCDSYNTYCHACAFSGLRR
jgi:hypothetical protein